MLGGAATHFALAASFFDEVRVVGPVGDDFGEDVLAVAAHARRRSPTTSSTSPGGKTFFWHGRVRRGPQLARDARHRAQRLRALRAQALAGLARTATCCSSPTSSPTCSARCASSASARASWRMDSMNLWIDIARDSLVETIPGGRLPDPQRRGAPAAHRQAEPRRAPRARSSRWGPRRRRRQAGQVRRRRSSPSDGFFALPAYPLERVVDPTGAGDTFAGGFVGYVAAHRERGGHRRAPRARDGLRDRDRLLQRRGVRHRARRAPDRPTRSPSASTRLQRMTSFELEPVALRG